MSVLVVEVVGDTFEFNHSGLGDVVVIGQLGILGEEITGLLNEFRNSDGMGGILFSL